MIDKSVDTISLREFQLNASKYLDRTVYLTRYNKVVAVVFPASDDPYKFPEGKSIPRDEVHGFDTPEPAIDLQKEINEQLTEKAHELNDMLIESDTPFVPYGKEMQGAKVKRVKKK